MKIYGDLEKRIREIGRGLYGLAGDVPSIFNKRRWMGRLMDHAMKDAEFRLNLFRYIDVLPSLKTSDLIIDLLQAYFSGLPGAPLIIRKGIDRISRGFMPVVASKMIKAGVRSIAGQFIAGEDHHDAIKVLGTLWEDGFAGSIDFLGEEVLSDKEARQYMLRYLQLMETLAPVAAKWNHDALLENDDRDQLPRFEISFKVTSLHSQLDPVNWDGSIASAKESIRPIVATARSTKASLCFDMEQYYCKDLVIETFKQVMEEFGDYPYAGIAIQAYLKESRTDLLGLIAWARKKKRRVSVRLVKGAYHDYETVYNVQKGWPLPVFENKEDTDNNFEVLTRILIENAEFVRPVIATHNIRSISHAIALAEVSNLPNNALEFQMLYGMGEPLCRELKKMGYRIRVYLPVGDLLPGMAYLVRRLLENTSNVSFLRGFFAENRSYDEIIKPPEPKPHRTQEELPVEFRNEPPLDFSKAENREKMREALQSEKEAFGKRYPIHIDGKDIFREEEIVSLNPADPEEIVGRVSSTDRNDAEQAAAAAVEAWDSWRSTAPEDRADFLFKTAAEFRKRRFELAALEVYEVGKTWKDADGDIVEAIDYLEFYGREMIRLGRPVNLGHYPGESNSYFYEPRGICLVISPWNFPLAISTGMVAAALVSGNCVIFKPSGFSPVTGRRLVDAFKDAGLPNGVLQYLPGPGREVGEYLVTHKAVDLIAFTGSKDVGLRLIKLAAETSEGRRNIKKVIAEMGGKNAIIIDETAELDETVKGVLESALGFQGQKCSACSRVITVGDIHDEFLGRLRSAIESLRAGLPEDPATLIGPVIDNSALKKIQNFIEVGKKEASLFFSREVDGKGFFAGPVIFVGVNPSSALAQEEIFGPVIAVIRAQDIDEAIEIANNSQYSLTGGIFSRNPLNINKACQRFAVGNLYINRKITGALVGRQPFGGSGMSGVGSKAGGPDYLLQFMNPRCIAENMMRRGFAPISETGER